MVSKTDNTYIVKEEAGYINKTLNTYFFKTEEEALKFYQSRKRWGKYAGRGGPYKSYFTYPEKLKETSQNNKNCVFKNSCHLDLCDKDKKCVHFKPKETK
jgi:hypothetical protein